MKKFLILILCLFTPFANSDVVNNLSRDIDRNQSMEYQIVCITNNSSQREGYQYLVAQRLIKGVGSRVFINPDLPPFHIITNFNLVNIKNVSQSY